MIKITMFTLLFFMTAPIFASGPKAESAKTSVITCSANGDHGAEEMTEDIKRAGKEMANKVCRSEMKPESVTVTVCNVSLTWNVKKLCENFDKESKALEQ